MDALPAQFNFGVLPKLTKAKLKKVIKYFESHQHEEKETVTVTTKDGNTFEKEMIKTKAPPCLTDLADNINISRGVVYRWYDKYKPFRLIVDKYVEKIKHDYLVTNGLLGKYNPAVTQLILKTKHKYSDFEPESANTREVPKTFNVQINQFLASQGADPVPDKEPPKQLPAFKDVESLPDDDDITP